MILFATAAALLLAAVMGVLLWPLLRPSLSEPHAHAALLDMYRRQLADIEVETAQGRLDAETAAAVRAEITRRMLATVDVPAASEEPRALGWRFGAAVAIAGLVPAAALAIYLAVGMPAAIGGPPAPSGHDTAQMDSEIARLQQHLIADPGDIAGWALLGRTMTTLGRLHEAADAYRHVVALGPGDPEVHAQLGEILVALARGRVTPEAKAAFDKAPNDPRSRFYAAESARQKGDLATAKAGFAALLADTPKEAPWRQMVAARLQQLDTPVPSPSGEPPSTPGPTEEDTAAAAKMPPAERLQMIRGMVGGLAARLKAKPNDPQGWLMLARSYRVLGQQAEARTALRQANADNPGNLELMKAYLDSLSEDLGGDRPPPELVGLAAKVNALDRDDQPALWYLGLDAAARGDKPAATGYWQRLLAALPADDTRRAAIQQRLDALR